MPRHKNQVDCNADNKRSPFGPPLTKPSQIGSPHWNQINFDHLHKNQVSFDAHTEINYFRPAPKTSRFPRLAKNRVNFDPHTKTRSTSVPDTKNKINSALTAKTDQFQCPDESQVNFDPCTKIKSTSTPCLIPGTRYNVIFDALTRKSSQTDPDTWTKLFPYINQSNMIPALKKSKFRLPHNNQAKFDSHTKTKSISTRTQKLCRFWLPNKKPSQPLYVCIRMYSLVPDVLHYCLTTATLAIPIHCASVYWSSPRYPKESEKGIRCKTQLTMKILNAYTTLPVRKGTVPASCGIPSLTFCKPIINIFNTWNISILRRPKSKNNQWDGVRIDYEDCTKRRKHI